MLIGGERIEKTAGSANECQFFQRIKSALRKKKVRKQKVITLLYFFEYGRFGINKYHDVKDEEKNKLRGI